MPLKEGFALTKQGSPGGEAFLVWSGTARILVNGRAVGKVGPGDFVGEISLLDGAVRTASVVADSEMKVMVFTPPEFRALIETSPKIAMKLLTSLATRLRQSDDRLKHQ